jgi:hypothetical protein
MLFTQPLKKESDAYKYMPQLLNYKDKKRQQFTPSNLQKQTNRLNYIFRRKQVLFIVMLI